MAELDPFTVLRGILARHASKMLVRVDTPDSYALDAGYSDAWKKPAFFGGVKVGRSYVSYHLFPIYVFPDLVDDLSPALRRLFTGKSCFTFTSIDAAQARELRELTRRSAQRYLREGIVREAR